MTNLDMLFGLYVDAVRALPGRVTGGTFHVCQDCMLANMNDEHRDDRDPSLPPVWGVWEGEDVEIVPDFGAGDDGDDGHIEFSHLTCGGCGTELAGDRYRYSWLEVATHE